MPDDYMNLDPNSLLPSFHLGTGFYVATIITTLLFLAFMLYSLYLLARIAKAIEAVIHLDKNVQKLVDRLEEQPKTDNNPGAIRPA
jgi:hypothetical protein